MGYIWIQWEGSATLAVGWRPCWLVVPPIMMFVTASANAQLDELLDEICIGLQLTETQHGEAEGRYGAVGKWLAADVSELFPYQPDIYSQGSVRLRTTVKPRGQEEHDVDLICRMELPPSYFDEPIAVLDMVERRLNESKLYEGKTQRFKRCVRINYANEFHLDITPARNDPDGPGSSILVPDRKLERWKPSNPLGYAQWFESQVGREKRALFAERKIEPFPAREPVDRKAPLRRAVQLLKRHRDIVFGDPDLAPRSVALTTLAGHHYQGESIVTDSLLGILDNIVDYVDSQPGIIEVPNPSNPSEKFCEAWSSNPDAYDAFVAFVREFRDRFRGLQEITGLSNLARELFDMFGKGITKKAVASLTERVNGAREQDRIHFGNRTASLSVGSAATRVVPKTTFYGR